MALTMLCMPLLLLRGGGLSAPGKAASSRARDAHQSLGFRGLGFRALGFIGMTVLCMPLLLLGGGGLSALDKVAKRMTKRRTMMERDTCCYTLEHAEQMANLKAGMSKIENVGELLFIPLPSAAFS